MSIGFWMDVGQPKDYLIGMGLYLNYVRHSNPDRLSRENGTVGNVIVVGRYLFVSFIDQT
jgi:mannose-1-phosphate guanylyltransferase